MRCRPSRARPATWSACSFRTRCSRRWLRCGPRRQWPKERARSGRCRSTATHPDGAPFITAMFTYAGGVGARSSKPGLDACSYPTGVSAVPIEVVEASAPFASARSRCGPGRGRWSPDGWLGSDHRVLGRHRKGVAAQCGNQSSLRPTIGALRR